MTKKKRAMPPVVIDASLSAPRKNSIQQLIAASSLGTPGAVAVRTMGNALDEFEQAALEEVRQELRDKIADAIVAYSVHDTPTSVRFLRNTLAAAIRTGQFG